jgi:Rod binding domain-containing protein
MDRLTNLIPNLNSTDPGKLATSARTKGKEAAMHAAEEFEAVFLTTMLEGMFAGVKSEAPFGGGQGETAYRSLLISEYAKEMAHNGGIGIADAVYAEILAAQERSRDL